MTDSNSALKDVISAQVNSLKETVDARIASLKDGIGAVERSIEARVNSLKDGILGQFDGLRGNINGVNEQVGQRRQLTIGLLGLIGLAVAAGYTLYGQLAESIWNCSAHSKI